MKYLFQLTLISALLLCHGCRIIQTVPSGGDVYSLTGSNNCSEGKTCIVDVEDGTTFSDTFTAVPSPGYQFTGWAAGLCSGTTQPCVLAQIPGALTSLNFDAELKPEFKPAVKQGAFTVEAAVTTIPEALDNMILQEITPFDLNFDGYMDLIILATSYSPRYEGTRILALVNNRDGSFSDLSDHYFPDHDPLTWGWSSALHPADLNNDGLIDLVPYSHVYRRILSPFLRMEDGRFTPLRQPDLDQHLTSTLPMDIDNDGDVDLLRMNVSYDPTFGHDVHALRWLENTATAPGEISYVSHPDVINDNILAGPENHIFALFPAILDLNNDGYPDLIYSGPHYADGFVEDTVPIYVFLNTGNNSFVESGSSVFDGEVPAFNHTREIALADLDGSGVQSLVLGNSGYDAPPWDGEPNAILRNLGNGQLRTEYGNASTHDYRAFTHSLTVGDIDNDGDVDIVYNGGGADTVYGKEFIRILENDGNANFSNRNFQWEGTYEDGQGWTTCLLVDLNQDDYPELLLGGADTKSPTLILWNDGTGQFSTKDF